MVLTDERPPTKTALPFRAEVQHLRGQDHVVLEYESLTQLPNGSLRRLPHFLSFVKSLDNQPPSNPLGEAIYALMQLFFALEAEQGGLIRERDELAARVAELGGEMERQRRSEKFRDLERKRQKEA
jgi:hypothetical protein